MNSSTQKPLLHVVVPAYGPSPFLTSALQSLVAHIPNEIPITVIDDGGEYSEIFEIVQGFAKRVEYVRNSVNIGLAANFKKSFEISTGTFTLVMGSDDEILPEYFQALTDAVAVEPNFDIFQPAVMVIDADSHQITPLVDRIKDAIRGRVSTLTVLSGLEVTKKLLVGNFFYFPSIAWKTDLLQKQEWNLAFKHAVDLDLLFKLSANEARIALSPKQTFAYRRHEASVSSELANESTRLLEELTVHYEVLKSTILLKSPQLKLLAILAPTIRLHGLIIALKKFIRSPSSGIRHALVALSAPRAF